MAKVRHRKSSPRERRERNGAHAEGTWKGEGRCPPFPRPVHWVMYGYATPMLRLANPLAPTVAVAHEDLMRRADIGVRVERRGVAVRGASPRAAQELEQSRRAAARIHRARIQAGLAPGDRQRALAVRAEDGEDFAGDTSR